MMKMKMKMRFWCLNDFNLLCEVCKANMLYIHRRGLEFVHKRAQLFLKYLDKKNEILIDFLFFVLIDFLFLEGLSNCYHY